MASTYIPKPSPYQTRSRTLSGAKRKPSTESDHDSGSDSESEDEREASEDGYESDDEASEDAASRVARWHQRGIARKETQRVSPGRYRVGGGSLPVTVSGMNRQRISQTSKKNYEDQTLGAIPPYSKMQKHLNYPGAVQSLYDPEFEPPDDLTVQQKMATALATTASNVSEPDKAGGADKLIRALARRHDAESDAPHPLSSDVNPMVETAAYGRSVMSGETELNEDQVAAIDDYASSSSDEEEAPWAVRSGLLAPDPTPAPKKGRKRRKR